MRDHPPYPTSPGKLDSKLNVSRFSGAKDLSGRITGYILFWVIEVGLVEGIEKLGAELHPQALHQLEILHQTKVPILQTWPIDDTSPRVTKSGSVGSK